MTDKQNRTPSPAAPAAAVLAARPLSALLSQALVAFTLEVDNEFARRLAAAGYSGAGLSLVVWLNLMRFLRKPAMTVAELAAEALTPPDHLKPALGCLERWRFVRLEPESVGLLRLDLHRQQRSSEVLRRNGWGSGRGIRGDWILLPTAKGNAALEIWPPLLGEIEERWARRFGSKTIHALGDSLRHIVGQFNFALPHGLPPGCNGFRDTTFPPRSKASEVSCSLPVLLSQALFAFALSFDRRSDAPLALSANSLRVLGSEPIPEAAIPRLTGSSPETSGIGWPLKPYVAVKTARAGRGKEVYLTERGRKAQQTYHRLTRGIEKGWADKFGASEIAVLRESLSELFQPANDGSPKIREGIVPPPGVPRSGSPAPSLGRGTLTAVARQRAREMARQSQDFLQDPAAALPHYPLWDMNRGFGP